jgi:hypothetical protein
LKIDGQVCSAGGLRYMKSRCHHVKLGPNVKVQKIEMAAVWKLYEELRTPLKAVLPEGNVAETYHGYVLQSLYTLISASEDKISLNEGVEDIVIIGNAKKNVVFAQVTRQEEAEKFWGRLSMYAQVYKQETVQATLKKVCPTKNLNDQKPTPFHSIFCFLPVQVRTEFFLHYL